MQTPEEHLGALIAAYEDANRGDRALCEPSVRVKVNWGALAAADLIRARDAEVAEQVRAEFEDMEHRLSVLLCNLTGGLLSKTGYDVATMEQHIEDYLEREVVEPARAEVRADERAKVLAGFEWQFALRDERGRTRGLLASLTEADVPSTLTPMRRLVSPWEPTP